MVGGIRLPEHSHCAYCGDPIPFGQEFCDEECARLEAKAEADAQRKDVLFYVASIATVAVIVAIGLLI